MDWKRALLLPLRLLSALSTHLRFEKCSVYSVFELSTQSVSAENFAGCTSWVALDVFVADMLPSLLLEGVEVAVVAFEPGAAASAFAAVAVVDVVVVSTAGALVVVTV